MQNQTALEGAVLLLLGYEQEQYDELMYKTKAPPNPFKQAKEWLQAEINGELLTGPDSTVTASTSGSGNGEKEPEEETFPERGV